MKISWNWLKQLIDLKSINPNKLAEKLTLAGFEIENIAYQKTIKDILFEINIPANRHDINNMANLALEITALLKLNLKLYIKINSRNNNIKYKTIDLYKNLNNYKDLYYSFAENISINHSPIWIQNYLKASDIGPNNNMLDIVEFINFKWGQYIEIFYINQIEIEKHKMNFNKIREYAIKLNSRNINNIDMTNISILFIGHINKNNTINYVKKRHSIKSQTNLEYAFLDITQIIQDNYDLDKTYNKEKIIYRYKTNIISETDIICRISYLNKILGPINNNRKYLSKKEIINIMERLRFKVNDFGQELKIQIPQERQKDIRQEIDIIEEIARIYGFNNFNDNLPKIYKAGYRSSNAIITNKIRHILRSIGLHEVINYALSQSLSKTSIEIINPLNKDQITLRNNLIENLITSKLYNINKVNEDFEVFEIGKIFINNLKFNNRHEELNLAIMLGNSSFQRSKWNEIPNSLSWFQAKGTIEELFERIHVQFIWSTRSDNKYFIKNFQKYTHPTRTSYIQYKGKTIGIFGQIHNKIAKRLNISYKVYIFEISINSIIKATKDNKHLNYNYKPYSNYPKITRDISIQVDQKISMQKIIQIIKMIQKEQKEIIESINVFDEYYEKDITKKIGLRTTYRSITTTLTNKRIEKIEKLLKKQLHKVLIEIKSKS
uniref:phenylalanine--tRNA ligase n=1 Tax=Synarthrophyton chejuense TaxID=2485825 RepID=A0A3G3MFT3_9FLOR|nr:phenylalanyl-tRNA synthetase beta chain [Synarthrophyton chejuense]AYR05680.1 phenylalanyl-tRNA synthetase beta chain [Synarthrophyton chejuense]